MKYQVLIWGEFLPKTQTGISISNTNIKYILQSEQKDVKIIEEFTWNKSTIIKILLIFSVSFRVLFQLMFNRFVYFYFNIPLSKQGLFKLVFILISAGIFKRKTIFVGHLHRGDMIDFISKSRFNKNIISFCFNKIQKIITLSDIFEKQLIQIFPKNHFIILPNTSTIEYSGKMENNKFENKRYLYISNYIKAKGIIELVTCFASDELKDYTLETYGNIYENDTFNYINKIKTQNILINLNLTRKEIAIKLKENYDAIILPSWNEGQSILILEAMSVGMPVITTDVGDSKNLLGYNYPFFVIPNNTNSLKTTILKYIDFKTKNKLSELLYGRYIEKYSNNMYREKVKFIFK